MLDNAALTDPDHQTLPRRYRAELANARDAAGRGITDPAHRAAFLASAQDVAGRAFADIQDYARLQVVEQYRGALANTIDRNVQAAAQAQGATDAKTFLRTSHDLIDAAAENGFLTSDEARAMRRDDRLEMQVPDKETRGCHGGIARPGSGPDSLLAAAGKDASGDTRSGVAQSAQDRARVIFGETSGLYPQSIDPNRAPHDPANWQPDSYDNLQAARKYIGIVAGRNPIVKRNDPNMTKSLDRLAWQDAISAANAAHRNPDLLDPHITNYYLRGDGDMRPAFPNLNLKRYLIVGPFRNVGGGDAPAGNNLFIEFYGRP